MTNSTTEAVRALARLSRMIERASDDFSLAHYRVLAAVAEGDERASRVARRLALGKPAISASVDALCRRGLLTRGCAADDQRAVVLQLTPAGRRMLETAEAAMTARLDAVLAVTPRGGDVRGALVRAGVGADRYVAERRCTR